MRAKGHMHIEVPDRLYLFLDLMPKTVNCFPHQKEIMPDSIQWPMKEHHKPFSGRLILFSDPLTVAFK